MSDHWRLAPNQADLYAADRAVGQAADRIATRNLASVHRLPAGLDPAELAERLGQMVLAHPMLAARVEPDAEGGHWAPARPPVLHLSDVPFKPDTEQAARRRRRESTRPLVPSRGPLLRAVLLRYPDGRADLVLVAHQLVTDQRSAELMAQWLLAGRRPRPVETYRAWAASPGRTRSDRPPEPTCSARPPGRIARTVDADRVARLRDVPPAADLSPSTDWGQGAGSGADLTAVGRADLHLPASTWTAVGRVATDLGVPPHSVVLGAAALVLARNGGAATPVLGTTTTSRSAQHTNTIGCFDVTVLVPVAVDEDADLATLLRDTHDRCLAAGQTTDIPLSALVERPGTVPQCVVVPRESNSHLDLGTAPFPLTLYVAGEPDGGAHCLLRFQLVVIGQVAAERFCRQVAVVLQAIADDPRTPVHAVPVMAEPDRAAALALGRGAPVEVPETTIPALFAALVREAPDHEAITGPDTTLTYAELDDRATALARALVEAGVTPGERVGVRLDRGPLLVVALLAVLKAGAAYVPLDPSHPAHRTGFVVADSALRVVITDGDPSPGELSPSPDGLSPDGLSPGEPSSGDLPSGVLTVPVTAHGDALLPEPAAGDPAYVIYTSGSTGTPKGVVATHRNVVALLHATAGEFTLGREDVWSLFHSFAFDFSVWEIWGCLLTGGRLVIVPYWTARDPEEFRKLLVRERVSVLSQTPSAFAQLPPGEADLAVRLLVFGGEALDARMLLPWLDVHPERRCRVVNMYGITETTVHCTWHDVTRADVLTGVIAVGRPLPGWELYVLDERGRPVPPGVAGEIYVGGPGVTIGYLGRTELTAARFVPDLVTGRPGARLYRSGDRGRYLDDGRLLHLGRLDDQVQIRGHRVEPGEIRGALLADPEVAAAAVVVRRPNEGHADDEGDENAKGVKDGNDANDSKDAAAVRLDAYVVTGSPAHEVRARLEERLPEYLMPATVTTVAELPLTANGKVDRARLPVPQVTGDRPRPPPSAGVEAEVLAIWERLMGVPVGPDDNFFELGGNSLLAVRLNAALREAGFGSVQLRDIFRHSTVRRLAQAIEEQRATS
jgi:amino acid adenylation domain-containing protein